jgi:hypothetical protein
VTPGVIPVGFLTQNNTGSLNNCGPAGVGMVAGYYLDQPLTVRSMVGKVKRGAAYPNGFSATQVLSRALNHESLDVPSHDYAGLTIPDLERFLDEGRPPICLVDYSAYSDNPTQYMYAHFLVLKGFLLDATGKKWAGVNDPLRYGPTLIPYHEFVLSFSRASKYVKFDPVTGKALRDASGNLITGNNRIGVAVVPNLCKEDLQDLKKIQVLIKKMRAA